MSRLPAFRNCAAYVGLLLVLSFLGSGCSKSPHSASRNQSSRGPGQLPSELLKSVADNLNRLEQFDARQILPQIRDRLNQWALQARPTADWRREPMLDDLPPELQALPQIQNLEPLDYSADDITFLQEAVWLRDISHRVREGEFEDLPVGQRLFDWTIRNIQLEPDAHGDSSRRPHGSSEILLLGRGTAAERAWIFLLLARQQGLDGAILATADRDKPGALKPWLPALLIDGHLYLFDTRLGLPIPAPDGGVAELSQAAQDDQVLKALDLDTEHPYPVNADDLKQVTAYVEASPSYLARRMKVLEAGLTGQQKAVVSADASQISQKLLATGQVQRAPLWPAPYQVLLEKSKAEKIKLDRAGALAAARELIWFQPESPLAKGRVLQFKGLFDGAKGAKQYYMNARPSKGQLDQANLPPVQRELIEVAKQNASFWLGLITYEQGDYPVAVDYFARRTLESFPNGIWTGAARYNLARTYEAMNEPLKAAELLESDTSPQSIGNRLRARTLKGQSSKDAAPMAK